MLGTAIFLIASFIIIIFLRALTDIITSWWAYLLIALASAIIVMYDSHKKKKWHKRIFSQICYKNFHRGSEAAPRYWITVRWTVRPEEWPSRSEKRYHQVPVKRFMWVLRRLENIVANLRLDTLALLISLFSSGTSRKTVINCFSLAYPSSAPNEMAESLRLCHFVLLGRNIIIEIIVYSSAYSALAFW